MKFRILGAGLIAFFFVNYLRADLTNGLIAYYPFNGNANDATANGNNGTVSGATPTVDQFNKTNSAFHFAGNPLSRITINSTNLLLQPEFSCSVWVNFVGGTENPRIISLAGWEIAPLGTGSSRQINFNNLTASVNYDCFSGASFAEGIWHHVVAVRSTNAMSLYVDGQLRNSVTVTAPIAYSGGFGSTWLPTIGGNRESAFDNFGGTIDEIRIYNRALSSQEVTNLYVLEGKDSDGDGLSDFNEIYVYHTDPNKIDTDSDGLSDYQELFTYHTDPLNADTDGDGFGDGEEVYSGHNPLDSNDHPLALNSGLVAYYPLNGNADDASGSGNNGTVNGATLVADRFGTTNSAYSFQGTISPESNIKIFTTNLNLLPDFSLSVWVNFVGGTHNPRVFSTPGYEIVMVGTAPSRAFQFNDSSDSNVYAVNSSIYPQGTWHHVVGIRTTNSMAIYVDGQLQGTVAVVDFPTYSRPWVWNPEIGGNSGSLLDAFGGKIDDFHFYNRALSSLEVTNLYNLEQKDSDHDGLSDFEEIYLYHTDPNSPDLDGDGLKDGQEVKVYHTDPLNPDTDGDGFNDGAEVGSGHNPLDKNDTPGAILSIFTAIELEFATQLGKTYQLQTSSDLISWTNFDNQIPGDGNVWNKTFSTRNSPRLFYRVQLVP